MHRRTLIAIAIASVMLGSSATAAARRVSASPRPARGPHTSTRSTTRASRPDRVDWEKIKTASGLRRMALGAHRTAHFRAFAAYLGLSELVSIRPLAPGRCATAVTYLYNNLLDLEDAYPGENWTPLRRVVAKEPSIQACAPRSAKRQA